MQQFLSLESFFFTESKMISKKVGDEVTLSCRNISVRILTWKMNGEALFSLNTENAVVYRANITNRLDLKIFKTQSQLYVLTIENTQKFHEGNYTCEMTTDEGAVEEKWELLIKGDKFPHLTIHITRGSRKEQK